MFNTFHLQISARINAMHPTQNVNKQFANGWINCVGIKIEMKRIDENKLYFRIEVDKGGEMTKT